jgi:hypothetical protein
MKSVLPEWVEREIANEPKHVDKRKLAQIVTRLFGPISHRTIEQRPYRWRRFNNYAVTPLRPAIEAEFARFDSALEYRAGKSKKEVA